MNNKEIAIHVASSVTGVSEKNILSPSRKYDAVESRMIIALLLHQDGISDEAIGWLLSRCRVTILHTRRVADDLLSCSKTFRDKYEKAYGLYTERKSLRVS